MIFTETKLRGAYVIDIEKFADVRGFFALSWSEKEFAARGLNPRLVECNLSFNMRKGTLRGMHYQVEPHAQAKLVRCTMGAVYDVAIDLRSGSRTYKEWVGVELTAENRRMFYIPEGFAHGFQTLSEDTEVFYQMSAVYAPQFAAGVRWNDPAFGIKWPTHELSEQTIISRDRDYPDFNK